MIVHLREKHWRKNEKKGFCIIDQDGDIHAFGQTESLVRQNFVSYYKEPFEKFEDGRTHNLDGQRLKFALVKCTVKISFIPSWL